MLSVTCSFIRVLIMPIMSVMPINLAKVQTLAKCVAQKRRVGVFRRISGDFESLGKRSERAGSLRRNESFGKDFRKV